MLKVRNCKKSIQIIDYAEQKDYFMIVMERPLDCVDFWDYINDNGPLDEIKAKKYFKQIVEGVIELKSNGVLHRDIKDENILVDLINDEIKIIDFGASTHYTNQDLYDFNGNYFNLLISILLNMWSLKVNLF
jgi:serine/threonine protein kinase